ncbi:hypothetical protein VIGAN_03070100, partial [Vigna angularis var. angularis]
MILGPEGPLGPEGLLGLFPVIEPVTPGVGVFLDDAGRGLLVDPLLILLDDSDRVEIGRNGERVLESDISLFVIGFGDQQAAPFLLLTLHVQCLNLFDLEPVEGFKNTLDFDLRSGRNGLQCNFLDVGEGMVFSAISLMLVKVLGIKSFKVRFANCTTLLPILLPMVVHDVSHHTTFAK